jgi:uncharacterized protein (DUF1778 family)
MDVTPYVTALREDLLAAAAAGDEQTRRTAELLAAAIDPAVRLTLLNALADLASEVTEALDGERVVEVRLDGRQLRVAVSRPAREAAPEPEAPPPPPVPDAAGDVSRITLRLMEQLKAHAERAASAQGMSLNSWIGQAVQGALQQRGGWDRGGSDRDGGDRGGDQPREQRRRSRDDDRRLRGWVQG